MRDPCILACAAVDTSADIGPGVWCPMYQKGMICMNSCDLLVITYILGTVNYHCFMLGVSLQQS
jgi:hypothetical protein